MRVLFISDVYFPRVNGVSTSIRTFREDLAHCGVDTLLVAPDYAREGAASASEEARGSPAEASAAAAAAVAGSGILDDLSVARVPSARVPRDPEDRRMRWGKLNRLLESARFKDVDLLHIHTP